MEHIPPISTSLDKVPAPHSNSINISCIFSYNKRCIFSFRPFRNCNAVFGRLSRYFRLGQTFRLLLHVTKTFSSTMVTGDWHSPSNYSIINHSMGSRGSWTIVLHSCGNSTIEPILQHIALCTMHYVLYFKTRLFYEKKVIGHKSLSRSTGFV